jgi:hypothetical protein
MVRRWLGLTYWSLSQWAKLKVKNAVNFIGEFEHTLAAEAHRRGLDGVICGHIHHAVIRPQVGFVYVNCGDWVESCTAVIEHFDGVLEILRYTAHGPRADSAAPIALPMPDAAPGWPEVAVAGRLDEAGRSRPEPALSGFLHGLRHR